MIGTGIAGNVLSSKSAYAADYWYVTSKVVSSFTIHDKLIGAITGEGYANSYKVTKSQVKLATGTISQDGVSVSVSASISYSAEQDFKANMKKKSYLGMYADVHVTKTLYEFMNKNS